MIRFEKSADKVMKTPTLLNNRYQAIRVLGSGGFGETFLAEDTQMPSGRRCVIKQLKPVADNLQVYQLVQERFGREAAILEELGDGSNQIPRLYAYFVEKGQFYLVQEYIEGQTLTQKLEHQGRLSESSVKEILTNILPVLDYVHSKKIVHRDIKPDNILIRNSDSKPVLIDFGAVKETMGTIVTASGNSSQSIVIGTPGFMPSEQTAGRPLYSSDLYSLGLTAIYLLTGKIPQELACNPSTGEILWRQYAPSVTPSFATFLDKAIQSYAGVDAKRLVVRHRYSNAKEMLQALQTGTTPITTPIPQPNPTVISAPAVPYQQGVNYQQSSAAPGKGMSDWQKAMIMGGVIGACIIGGLWLTRGQQSTQPIAQQNSSPAPTTLPSQPAVILRQETTSTQPITPTTPVQSDVTPQVQISSPQKLTQPVSIGWLRLGSVSNTSNNFTYKEPLIPTNQPVTISPPVVPSPNSQVILTTDVNLRSNPPQPPEYKLIGKISTLKAQQRLVILRVESFVDPNSDSQLTKVWAEVGLPN